jgi:hypothetical protein
LEKAVIKMFKLVVERHSDGSDLDVRVGFERAERPVVKTVRKDNVSVGFNSDGSPVFVRMRDAKGIAPVFGECLKHDPSHDEQKQIVVMAMDVAVQLTMEYNKSRLTESPEEIELTVA